MVGSDGHVTRPHVRAGLEGEHRRSKSTGRSTMACPGFQQSDDIRQNHRLKHYRPAERFTYLRFREALVQAVRDVSIPPSYIKQ